MAVIFKPKTSTSIGLVPSLGQLEDGEIAINFSDSVIYQRVGSTVKAISTPETFRNLSVDNQVPWLSMYTYTLGTTKQLTVEAGAQLSNTVLAGPSTKGGAGVPDFRALVRHDIPFPRDYISGLSFRTNNTHIIISQGSVVLSDGSFVEVSAQTISPSRAANTRYYLYVTSSGTVERTTAVPSVVFWGSARASSAGGVNRFIGMVATDASGNYLNQWTDFGNNQVSVQYIHNTTALTPLTNNGTSTTPANLSMAQWLFGGVLTQVILRLYHNGTGGSVRLYTWNGSAFVIYTNIQSVGGINTVSVVPDATPQIQYDVVGTGAQIAVTLMGYNYAR